MLEQTKEEKIKAGLLKIFMAIMYDTFFLSAVLIIATAIQMPLNNGKAIEQGHPYQLLFGVYLLAICFGYFGWFWTHGGQTPGMKTWRLKVQSIKCNTINWPQSLLRFVAAGLSWSVLGAGYFWILLHAQKQSWHDIISKSEIIVVQE